MPLRLCLRRVSAAILCAGVPLAAGAGRDRRAPPQPADWKPGAEARAYASGAVRAGREFVWGQSVEPASGVFRLKAVDNTWHEDPASEDALLECVARVRVPSEQAEYYLRMTRLEPVGGRRATMGGVMVNGELFGSTNLGGPGLFPRLRAYAAVWGRANVVRNGRVIGRDRAALAWVGQGARDAKGRWLYEPDPRRVAAHLVVFGALDGGSELQGTPEGFLHFAWVAARVIVPGFTHDPAAPSPPARTGSSGDAAGGS